MGLAWLCWDTLHFCHFRPEGSLLAWLCSNYTFLWRLSSAARPEVSLAYRWALSCGRPKLWPLGAWYGPLALVGAPAANFRERTQKYRPAAPESPDTLQPSPAHLVVSGDQTSVLELRLPCALGILGCIIFGCEGVRHLEASLASRCIFPFPMV